MIADKCVWSTPQAAYDYMVLLLNAPELAVGTLQVHEFNDSLFTRIINPELIPNYTDVDLVIAKHLHGYSDDKPWGSLISRIKAIIVEYNASINPKVTITSDLDLTMLENYRLQNQLLRLQISAAKPLPSSLKFDATTVSEEDLDKIRKYFNVDKMVHPIPNYSVGRDEHKPLTERVYRKGNILHLVFEEEPCYKVDDKSGIKPELMKYDYVIELDADNTASDIITLIKKKATEWTASNSRVTLIFSNIL